MAGSTAGFLACSGAALVSRIGCHLLTAVSCIDFASTGPSAVYGHLVFLKMCWPRWRWPHFSMQVPRLLHCALQYMSFCNPSFQCVGGNVAGCVLGGQASQSDIRTAHFQGRLYRRMCVRLFFNLFRIVALCCHNVELMQLPGLRRGSRD